MAFIKIRSYERVDPTGEVFATQVLPNNRIWTNASAFISDGRARLVGEEDGFKVFELSWPDYPETVRSYHRLPDHTEVTQKGYVMGPGGIAMPLGYDEEE